MTSTASGCSLLTLQSPKWHKTVQETIPLIPKFSGAILVQEFIQDFLEHLEPLSKSLSCLDNKDKSNTDQQTRDGVVAVLQTINEQCQLQGCVMDRLNVASAVSMLSVHLLAPMTLMRNPEEYAEQARHSGGCRITNEDEDDRQPGPSSGGRSRGRQSAQRRRYPSTWDKEGP